MAILATSARSFSTSHLACPPAVIDAGETRPSRAHRASVDRSTLSAFAASPVLTSRAMPRACPATSARIHPNARFTSFNSIATVASFAAIGRKGVGNSESPGTVVGLLGIRHVVVGWSVDSRGRDVDVTACGRQVLSRWQETPDTVDCRLCVTDQGDDE